MAEEEEEEEGTAAGGTQEDGEREIIDLLAQSKWAEAVAAYKAHLSRSAAATSDPDWHGVGTRTVEDDIHSMLNLYCKHLQANVIEPLQLASGIGLLLLFDTFSRQFFQRKLFILNFEGNKTCSIFHFLT